jgi:uncharacterized protein (TIGR03067 family)
MKCLVVAALIVALLGIARAGDQKKTDAEKIQGPWKVLSAKETAGFNDNIDVAEYQGSVWTFAKKEFTISKGKAAQKLAYALDPAKRPKQIDIGKDPRFLGIYKLQGNKLTICYTVFNIRPTDFSMGKGIAAVKRLVVLQRQKK